MFRILSLLLIVFTSSFRGHAVTVFGSGAKFSDQYVAVYRYTNHIVKSLEQIAEVKADAKGNFTINVPVDAIGKIKIACGDQSLSFLVLAGSNYSIQMQAKGLSVAEDKPGLNDMCKAVDSDLKNWYHLFIDSNGLFTTTSKPEEVFKKLDEIKQKYHQQGNELFNRQLDYYMANDALFYITTSYARYDSAAANRAFDDIERNFIIARIDYTNPLYMKLLASCIYERMNSKFFTRSWKQGFAGKIKEVDRFKNDSLRELSRAIIINNWYSNKGYKQEGKTLEQFNKDAREILSKCYVAICKRYLAEVIAANNNIVKGSLFPVVNLPDHNGIVRSLSEIHSPYVLVDFWATWCGPCKEEMAQFPDLLEQYKDKLEIVSISTDNDYGTMKDYLDEKKYSGKWNTLYNGPAGKYLDQVKVDYYPYFLILDRNKSVVAIPTRQELKKVLAETIR